MKKYAFIFLLFVCCASAFAYTRITTSSGETPKWSSMPVSYWINEKGLSTITNGSEFAAIQAAFHTWELVPSADVHLSYRGTTSIGGVSSDGFNIITFSDTTTPMGSSTIAATFTWFRNEIGTDGLLHPAIGDADIAFNPALSFSTSGEVNKFDIQSILTHEIGHFLGLDHSGMVSSVMVPFGVTSQLDQRTLAYDDIAGITDIYPIASAVAGLGQIRGTLRLTTAAVFGASVVAVNSDGTSVVSTLSQKDGTYALKYLPPGTYRVYAEPLDLPVAPGNISGFYSSSRVDFGTTYFGNVSTLSEARTVTVTAGTPATADIALLPNSATGLNLTRPGFGVRVPRGRSGTLTIGGADITAGVVFSTSSPDLVLGTPTFGGPISSVAATSAKMDLSISPSTALGPKNIAVNRGADASILSGALVITDANPSSILVTPNSGPVAGNMPVTITGANFRPGAQVYFGGLTASSVNVVDSGTILANTPQNPPGALNVVVVNSDGTWGVTLLAFNYESPAPVITDVTPLSGPPTTTVTISGQNFDSHVQNISVQFNGVSSRVINATPTTINTVVPFGTTTGPITISVFGKSATGPVFNVAQVSASTNAAPGAFNFIDATAVSGGSAYTFSSDDDGQATTTLPFDFSLFNDVYLAGSPVTLTTNGFISFESVPVVEYQNGSLPGKTVTHPQDGSTGVVPQSLIAPFWDDLLLKPGAQVTTRTVGNAPNRQFVIEWSNMTILDEVGTDQGANLTFELILYEGTNDIQFLYKSMSGPRSDGSSATVGAQNLARTTAVQAGFNQAIISSGFFKTYHFTNGAYLEVQPDSTPPSRPLVIDEGTLTANNTRLAASWTSTDPESGIREFQYAIGTTPGFTDVKAFTSTTQNSAVITGLTLQPGMTYYFAVKAVNGTGVTSDVGISDGIRYDATYQPQIKIIPSAPASNTQFSGIALLAPTAMTVVLRAYDSNGAFVLGPGISNPATISLAAGQQYARVLSELFGLQAFDGWIEVEASAPGLGIFTASGKWDLTTLDGSVARDPSTDFVLFHSGATAIFVNPSPRIANVAMSSLTTGGTQTFSIPPRGRFVTTLSSAVRVQSSEALATIERNDAPGKLAINAAVPVSDAQAAFVIPQAVIGGGYTTTLIVANVGLTPQNATVRFGSSAATINVAPNTATTVSLGTLFQLDSTNMNVGAVTVTSSALFGSPSLVGVVDIESGTGLVTIGARPAAIDFAFPHVVNGNGLFTGIALATGNGPASITIEVYDPSGTLKGSGGIMLSANQQLARLVSEFVAGVATQSGGYIKVRSDQPIWAWEIYGSGDVMASGPPL